ncbi:MAG: penicillin-binding protein activator, partial [Nitrospinota bacterium]|nr:penicillin-binding protein activator [Nitrospinota bacterium]
SLIEIYKAGFPADLLLIKKMSIYREQSAVSLYKSTLEEFLTKFPQHKKSEGFKRDLKKLEQENSDRNIELAILLPLTGKLAATGQQVLQGIQLAYSLLPEDYRRKVFLNVKDSSDSVSIEKTVGDLARTPKTVGMIGPLFSDEIKRSSVIADSFKLPIFTPTASSADLVDLSPYIFRNALTRKIQARFLAEYSINKLKLKRFAILYPSERYGEELKDEFLRSVEKLGGEVVGMASYDRTQNDFKNQILELGGIADDDLDRITRKQLIENLIQADFSDPTVLSRPKVGAAHWSGNKIENLKVSLELGYDAIFIPGIYDKVGLIIPQLAFYNIENIALLGTSGWNSPELIKMGGKFLKSIYFVDGFYSDSHKMNVKKFVQQFQNNYGERPSHLSAQAYDAAGIVFQAIIAGANNRVKLKNKLLQVKNYPGVTGRTDITKSGDSEKNIFALTVRRKKIVEEN